MVVVGTRVQNIEPGGAADVSGKVRIGDRILMANGLDVSRSSTAQVRRPFFDRTSHSMMPLSFTPLLRLKRCHACDQWHSSRASTCLLLLPLLIPSKH
jgi:hypothetical protein